MVAFLFLEELLRTVSHIWIINSEGPLRSLWQGICMVCNGGFGISIEVSHAGICLLQDGVFFVSQKNLVSRDAVLFLRGENGELMLGIRRAGRPRNNIPNSTHGSQNMNLIVLSPVANAIST